MNIARMKKDEIVWMSKHRCKHGVSYLEHPNCYLREQGTNREKIAFFDIEASNLSPEFGITTAWALRPPGGPTTARVITKKEVLGDTLDKQLLKELFKEIVKYDKVITYYGTRFDIPFLRTRAVMLKLPFPIYGDLKHIDLYFNIRHKFKLNRNRLDAACRSLLGGTKKTYLLGDMWIRTLQGKKEALDYVKDHNMKDVEELERLYMEVDPYWKPSNKSV